MQDWFINNLNIEGQGGVVAAPSTSDPDYYYAWQRDAAISMREYMNIANLSSYQTVSVALVGVFCVCVFWSVFLTFLVFVFVLCVFRTSSRTCRG